jgi:hypothetical protein
MLINVRSSSSLPSSATTLSTSRPDTNLAPNTASLMCSGSGGAAVPLPLDHPAGRNPRTAANVPFPCPPACCHRILYPLGMMPLGPPHDSSTGRSERMLEGLLGGIGGSRFYRLLVGGSRLEQRRNYVWYWPRGPVSDRSPLGFITIVRMLRKAYVGAGVEVSREEQRRVHAWQINLARSYWLGG